MLVSLPRGASKRLNSASYSILDTLPSHPPKQLLQSSPVLASPVVSHQRLLNFHNDQPVQGSPGTSADDSGSSAARSRPESVSEAVPEAAAAYAGGPTSVQRLFSPASTAMKATATEAASAAEAGPSESCHPLHGGTSSSPSSASFAPSGQVANHQPGPIPELASQSSAAAESLHTDGGLPGYKDLSSPMLPREGVLQSSVLLKGPSASGTFQGSVSLHDSQPDLLPARPPCIQVCTSLTALWFKALIIFWELSVGDMQLGACNARIIECLRRVLVYSEPRTHACSCVRT